MIICASESNGFRCVLNFIRRGIRAIRHLFFLVLSLVGATGAHAQELSFQDADLFQKPSQEVSDALAFKNTFLPITAPDGSWLLIKNRDSDATRTYERDMVRAWGVDFDRNSLTRNSRLYFSSLIYVDAETGRSSSVELPAGADIRDIIMRPNGQGAAFLIASSNGSQLWYFDKSQRAARLLNTPPLNGLFYQLHWVPGRDQILVLSSLKDDAQSESVRRSRGPHIRQALNGISSITGAENPLKVGRSEELFGSVVTLVDPETNVYTTLGPQRLYNSIRPSPDGNHILAEFTDPSVPSTEEYWEFPDNIGLFDLADGSDLRLLASHEETESGLAKIAWDPTHAQRLFWFHDVADQEGCVQELWSVKAAHNSVRTKRACLDFEYGVSYAGPDGSSVLMMERGFPGRPKRGSFVETDGSNWNVRSVPSAIDGGYDLDGPMSYVGPAGVRALYEKGGSVFFRGFTASDKGKRPTLFSLSIDSLEFSPFWVSPDDAYETVRGFCEYSPDCLITQYEDPKTPRNVVKRQGSKEMMFLTRTKAPKSISSFQGPEILNYTRSDGVDLTAKLYLPEGYVPGENVPVILWAYPKEYTSKSKAGLSSVRLGRFENKLNRTELLPVLNGYAVLTDVAMPVLGDDETGNDRFVEEIQMNAEAVIEELKRREISDGEDIVIAGKSYGAFMAMNLLAHTDLFRSGIGLSGAYNRTLTPFGFQNDKRTLWDNQDLYLALSPFLFADQIKEPVLLIHGYKDANAATPYHQSTLMYEAIVENGGQARLVVLPEDGHNVTTTDGVLQVASEILSWTGENHDR